MSVCIVDADWCRERATEKRAETTLWLQFLRFRGTVVWVRGSSFGSRDGLESFSHKKVQKLSPEKKVHSVTWFLLDGCRSSMLSHRVFLVCYSSHLQDAREIFFSTHTPVFMLPWDNEIMRETCRQPKCANHTGIENQWCLLSLNWNQKFRFDCVLTKLFVLNSFKGNKVLILYETGHFLLTWSCKCKNSKQTLCSIQSRIRSRLIFKNFFLALMISTL